MISKLQSARLAPPATITLQVFQSPSTAFSGDDCRTGVASIEQDGSFRHVFELSASQAYLRMDIAEYFTKISGFKAMITVAGGQQPAAKEYDLSECRLSEHQLVWSDDTLLCGYDGYCILDNPLAGEDVVVTIRGTIETGI
jgi:hypothetical protein